ncbi:MAG: GDSL-type esterase/lipase family protein [Pyrinomonadaceae bacterium]
MRRQTLSFILTFALLVTSFAELSPARAVYAQQARTHVVDTLVDASGNPRVGKVTFILTRAASSPGGIIPVGASVTAVLNAQGRFDVYLYPSTSLSPAAYYQAYFTDTTAGNQTLLGVYNIPAATTVVTLAPNRVTDTALAAQYTFASQTSVTSLSQSVSGATLASLLPVPPTNNVLQKYSAASGTFANSSVTDDGTTVSIGGSSVLKAADKNTANGVAGLDAQSKLAASLLPAIDLSTTTGVLEDARVSSTLTNKILVTPIVNIGSDATGDLFYRRADGKLARIAIGTAGQILAVGTNGLPTWINNTGSTGGTSPAPTPPVVQASAAPVVTTGFATVYGSGMAGLPGTINPNGGTISEYHFDYGTTTSYGSVTPSKTLPAGSTAVSVSEDLFGLTGSTTYHYRLRATNSVGETISADKDFITPAPQPPVISLGATLQITSTSARSTGIINPNTIPVTDYHFEYGTTTAYGSVTPSATLPAGRFDVQVTPTLSGLTPGTLYHFRLRATNAAGEAVTSDDTFTTNPASAPTVATAAATVYNSTEARLAGTVNPNGLAITDYHFDYGTTTAYGSVTPARTLSASASASSITEDVSGLASSSTIHYRLRATNSVGETVSSDATLTTPAPTPPFLTRYSATSITTTSAALNGLVNPNGRAVTDYHFDYGTTNSFGSITTAGTLPSGHRDSTVSANLTGLTASTIYYYHLRGTNSAGEATSDDGTFTTLPVGGASIPSINEASGIAATSATLNGTINPNGTPVSAYRFDYGTTSAYGSITTAGTLPSGSSVVAVTASVTGLTASTLYHYRLRVTNSAGESFTRDGTFTPVAPSTDALVEYRFDEGTGQIVGNYAAPTAATLANLGDNFHAVLGTTSAVEAIDPTWAGTSLNSVSTQYATATKASAQSFAAMTVYAAARRSGTPNNAAIVPIIGGAAANQFGLFAENANGTAFGFNTSTVTAHGTDIRDNAFHILTGTYDGTLLRVYLDNTLFEAASAPGLSAVAVTNLLIGKFSTTGYFSGDLAYASIYASAHADAQIISNVAAIRGTLAGRSITAAQLQTMIVFEGDSLTTWGTATPLPYTDQYSYKVATAITPHVQARNVAVGGSGMTQVNARAAAVDATLRPGRKQILSLLIGANDVGSGNRLEGGSAYNAAEYFRLIKLYCQARRAAGWKVVLHTLLPNGNAGFNAERNTLNALIRADNSFYDALADGAANTTIGTDAAASDPTLYPDTVHLSPAAHSILAPITRAAIESLL